MDDIDWEEHDSVRRDLDAENRAEAEAEAFRDWQDDPARWEGDLDEWEGYYFPGSGPFEDVGLDPTDEAIAGADAHGESL